MLNIQYGQSRYLFYSQKGQGHIETTRVVKSPLPKQAGSTAQNFNPTGRLILPMVKFLKKVLCIGFVNIKYYRPNDICAIYCIKQYIEPTFFFYTYMYSKLNRTL